MVNNSLTVLRSILFPRTELCTQNELYFRLADGSVQYCEAENCLKLQGTAAFDTYFNGLPLSAYQHYCIPSALFLRLRVCGSFVLRVFGVHKHDVEFCETLLTQKEIHCSAVTENVTDLSAVLQQENCDMLYFTLQSSDGVLYGGEFLCGSERPFGINIAVVICTFRRESFLLRNYRQISSYLNNSTVLHRNNIHLYIVDNGRTLDSAALNSDFITVIPNDNTGGSGGFSRGYYEAVRSEKDYTHILFMDDDILLDCEMLLRVYSLLRIRKPAFEDLAVGGTMLKLSDMVTQHEAGALWDGKRLHSIGNGIDMTQRRAVFESVYYPECDYNAWWFYCFPADWQKQYGYPLQFFVKEDDIEYSLRCASHIAVLSGIAVWHDDFDGKYDGFQEYYIKRNELILTSVHKQKSYLLFQLRKLLLSVMKQTVYQRYFLADIIIRAYRDYLKGWKAFNETDTVLLNEELMTYCNVFKTDEELLKEDGVYFDPQKYETSLSEPENLKKQALSCNGYLIPYVFYHKDQDNFSVCDLARCRIVNFYKHKRVLHYDPDRQKGFVTRQKKGLLFWNLLRVIGLSVRFLVQYPFVRRGYRKHLKELGAYPKA